MNNRTGDESSTVLVVEDEEDEAELYTEFLSGDYAVRTAHSGEEALELVDSSVGVVLLDRRMVGVSGDEVLQRIRARELDCRVVMVTAVSPDLDVLDLPFDDYLVKPVSRQTIRDTVAMMHRRNACDETIQQVVALASKMATLEAKLDLDELDASSEYAALETRFTELWDETDMGASTDDLYTEFTADKIRALFSELEHRPTA